MPAVNVNYFNPLTGLDAQAQTTVSLVVGRTSADGGESAFLKATRGSAEEILVDISEAYRTCLYGNGMTARPGRYMSRLSQAEDGASSPGNTTLTVENTGAATDALPRGLNLTAGDVVAIVDYFKADGTPNTKLFRYVVSVTNATDFVINTALSSSFNKGAMVFNLAYGSIPLFGTGRGSNKMDGVKSYYEAPVQPTIANAPQLSPVAIIVTITEAASVLVNQSYDIYVRSSLDDFAAIEPHWVADASTTTPETPVTVTTYDGGTAAGGGNLNSSNTYNVLVVGKDYRGSIGRLSIAKGSPTRELSFTFV